VSVTVSIGVAERTDRNEYPEAVIKAADRALYRAKRAGRNRVVG
jgi:diguanylate cyclase (GGDEF)-like protein